MTTTIDKLGLLLIADSRLLMARSRGKSLFYVPGGKRDPGETDLQALTREIREELNVELIADSLDPAGAFEALADGKTDGTLVRVTCYFGRVNGTPQASAEIAELAWLGSADMSRLSIAGQLIIEHLRKRDLID